MKFNYFILLLYIILSIEKKIKDGVYSIINDNLYLDYNKGKISLNANFKYPNTFFRIKKIIKTFNNSFYYIEELINHLKLSYFENNELNFIGNESLLWNFLQVDDKNYVIQNYEKCYIIIKNSKVFCDNIPLDYATKFKIIKIFTEVNEKLNSNDFELLNKEPIDVLIKYIDLNDPNLNRDGIYQIEKDYDNEELRYSIRSILDNIPWIRKIFILMPNEKVRYFKESNLINEKIIYVKDKDLLGYDSSNCNAFLFRYWKMKKFGISDNLIVMDDDYFIGNKLEKSDFFYVKNGIVVPSIITSDFLKIEPNSVQKNCELYEKKANISQKEQNNDEFLYSKYLTYAFLLKLFNVSINESIYIPNFSHNAIPVNLKDIKEIYDLTYMSQYKYASLDCLYRISGYLQFQIFIQSYTFKKYNRKVKNIPHKFIQLSDSISVDYNNIYLFCINKGSGNYSYLNFYKAKIIMEYLFPTPSPYEIIDYSIINISFNITYSLDQELKMKNSNHLSSRTRYKKYSNILEFKFILFIILIFIKFHYRNYYYDIILDIINIIKTYLSKN
jgi:hypothetical protein